MKRILLTGCNGQLGAELAVALRSLGLVITCDRRALDLTQPDAMVAKMREVQPLIVVNAAAYTAVDRAESEPALAHAVNAVAPGILAKEAARMGALLVHYSTDYVFDGRKAGAYDEQDAPNPLNVYGLSKLAGEHAVIASGAAHLIFRTSWVYGTRGNNFLLTMLKLAAERKELDIVNDQFGAPTWARDIAQATAAVLCRWHGASDAHRIFHMSSAGSTTWFGFAQAIFAREATRGQSLRLLPVGTIEYAAKALRPRTSILDCRRLQDCFDVVLPNWEESLYKCMRVIAEA